MEYKFWGELDEETKKGFRPIQYNNKVSSFFRTQKFVWEEQAENGFQYITEAVYTNDTVFNGIDVGGILEFQNCYFTGDFRISGSCNGKLTFKNCVFEKELIIDINTDYALNLDLIDVLVQKQLIIFGGKFNEVRTSFQRNPVIKINGGEFKDFTIGYWGKQSEIKDIYFETAKIDGVIALMKSAVQRIHISGNNKKCELYFEGFKVASLTIYRFLNEGRLRIQNMMAIKPTERSEIVVYDSKLTNTEFYETDLSKFNVILHDSFVSETLFINIEWPKYILPYGGTYISDDEKKIPSKIIEAKKQKDVYRQIKFALNKQGDTIGEHYFHSLEMITYNKTLSGRERRNWGTKLVIGLSNIFSDFGQSLSLPFLWLIGGGYFLYLLMISCFSYGNYKIVSCANNDWNVFLNAFAEFIRILNPLHKNDPELMGWLLLIDIILRIWSSYMLYNFIRASRRFIK